jgi:hypothetical protein
MFWVLAPCGLVGRCYVSEKRTVSIFREEDCSTHFYVKNVGKTRTSKIKFLRTVKGCTRLGNIKNETVSYLFCKWVDK